MNCNHEAGQVTNWEKGWKEIYETLVELEKLIKPTRNRSLEDFKYKGLKGDAWTMGLETSIRSTTFCTVSRICAILEKIEILMNLHGVSVR